MASLGRNPSLSLATQYSSIHSPMFAILQDFHHIQISLCKFSIVTLVYKLNLILVWYQNWNFKFDILPSEEVIGLPIAICHLQNFPEAEPIWHSACVLAEDVLKINWHIPEIQTLMRS